MPAMYLLVLEKTEGERFVLFWGLCTEFHNYWQPETTNQFFGMGGYGQPWVVCS